MKNNNIIFNPLSYNPMYIKQMEDRINRKKKNDIDLDRLNQQIKTINKVRKFWKLVIFLEKRLSKKIKMLFSWTINKIFGLVQIKSRIIQCFLELLQKGKQLIGKQYARKNI